MGKFTKKVLTTYIDSECRRQLFLLLGEKDKRWLKPYHELIPLARERIGLVEVQKLGNIYQQKVYNELIALPNTQFAISPYNNIVHSSLNEQSLITYYEILQNTNESFCLLEKEIFTPDTFLDFIFNHNPIFSPGDKYVLDQSERLIPDIILLGNELLPAQDIIYELLETGEVREVRKNELRTRFALNIIDIKMTNEEKVNKRQFIEITFYLLAFAHYLKNFNLTDKFFVNVQLSGILPLLNTQLLRMRRVSELLSKMVFCNWIETKRIFDNSLEDIKDLVIKIPYDKKSIELKIQPACGRCNYLDDCKVSLNGNDPNPGNWDIRLIPYTTLSLSDQLNQRNFKNITDVCTKPLIINDPPLPESIYSEMPLIKLKAESLLKNDEVLPTKEQITTVAIPSQNFAPCSISFTVESDPIHNRIFGASIYLSIVVFKGKYRDLFEDFWLIVSKNFRDSKNNDEELIIADFTHLFPFSDSRSIKPLIKILKTFFAEKAELNLKNESTLDGNPRKVTSFRYAYAYVNDDLTDQSEYALSKALLVKLWDIITLCTIIEENIFVEEVKTFIRKDGSERQYTVVHRPKCAIYYWSYELLDYFEEMTERHLVMLLADPSLRPIILKILNWISPSESKVKDSQTHKKIYDLRIFAETIIGLPFIINYSWHDVYNNLPQNKGKQKDFPYFYWTPHFNYMDFNVWFRALNQDDTNKAQDYFNKIKNQLLFKVQALNQIRSHFQNSAKGLINPDATPVDNKEIGSLPINHNHHPLSHAWVMYNLLTNTVSEMEVYEYRTMYPEYSIGRLNGAEITLNSNNFVNQTTSATGLLRYYYYFQLKGLSSHMRVEEGATVYLIPNDLRNKSANFLQYNFKVKIASLEWDDNEQCYHVKTENLNQDIYELARDTIEINIQENEGELSKFEDIKWYIYPTSIEAWQKKLLKLLAWSNFGISWLGFRLAYLWGISANAPKEISISEAEFSLPEIYFYYPQVLSVYETNMERNLQTEIFPSPNNDESQKIAINFCLGRTISGIQGPPGTGKSQTIVALVDEFLLRNKSKNDPVRIFITAFSYQALQVLIEKFHESVDTRDNPSNVSKIKRIFLRSEYRDPLSRVLANDLVKSGNSWKYNDKSRLTNGGKSLEDHIGTRYIIFSVTHQFFNLFEKEELLPPIFSLDMLIVDEASQLPVDYLMSTLRFINKGNFVFDNLPISFTDVNDLKNLRGKIIGTENLTKLVFVGDHNQLPPVQPVKPPIKLEGILSSVFTYFFTEGFHNLESKQLEVNYRSHQDIVLYTSSLGYYHNLRAHKNNATKEIIGNIPETAETLVKSVLEPSRIVNAIIHSQNFETSVSLLEASIAKDVLINYYQMIKPSSEEEEMIFWTQEVGVVAPHNAQSRLIIRLVHNELRRMNLSKLSSSKLMLALKGTIFSVEKFQGSARTLIIASIGVSSKDQLMAEEEFLYELTRFNVLTSRAKSKFILICSKNFIDYYPNDNKVLDNSTKIRYLASKFCNREQNLTYKLNDAEIGLNFRWFS
jgi:hypothetical protein